MTTHELKCWPQFFDAIHRGDKKFELRRDDRLPVFSVGDTLLLREWDPDAGYTGREIEAAATYVLRNGEPASQALGIGFCVISIEVKLYRERGGHFLDGAA